VRVLKLELTLPLPISINKLYINQFSFNPKTKSRQSTGKRILSKDGERVKKEIIQQANDQLHNANWNYDFTIENYIYMDTIIYFNRKGRDDNNVYKLLCDSLEKIVYENDSRVLIRTQKILYDKENPRVEVKFSPVEYRGIFPDEGYLEYFETRCQTCKRYKNNCSILREAKEGRVQSDIDENYICSKYKEVK
jgi:Holliday junction resolvase RusA-like endonuclease